MEGYWSRTLGNLYFDDIKEDMGKFSELAKELNTTTDNILRYVIIQKLFECGGLTPERVIDILDCLEEIKEAITNKED